MIHVTATLAEGETLKNAVTTEVDTFEQWFRTQLGNGDPLARSERAILNDYLAFCLQRSKLAPVTG